MANAEGQAENLRPPTHEEAKERGRKGGVSSGRSRKRRKAFRELVDAALRGRGAMPALAQSRRTWCSP